MIKCPNCNHDVAEGNVFCPNCGARLVAAEPVQEPQEVVTPVAPAAPAEPAAPAQEPKAENAKATAPFLATALAAVKGFLGKAKVVLDKVLDKIPLPRKIVGIIAGGVAALLVLAIVLIVVFSGGKDPEYALYVKDGDLFFSNLKKGKEVEIMDFHSDLGSSIAYYAGNASAINEGGTRLFYPEVKLSGYALYYRDLNKDEGEKIDSDVTSYAINAKGSAIIYMKDGNLYKSDLKEKEKLASDISRFYVSENFKNVLYTKSDGDLYFKSGNKDAVKLSSEASLLAYDEEKLEWVFFSKEGNLYFQKTNSEDKVKVDSEYSYFETALEGGKAYYIKSNTVTTKLWDYVIDDLAASDAAMTEPVAPEWPTRETYPEYPDRPWRYEFDTTEEYEAAYAEYEKELEKYNAEVDRINDAYDAAKDKYYEDQEAYYDARDAWWDKENRDSLRESLKEQEYEYTSYSLYYFNGKESKLVVENLEGSYSFNCLAEVAAGYAEVIVRGEAAKVKMSEVSSVWDVRNQISSGSDAAAYKVIWEDQAFDVENDEIYQLTLSYDAKAVYYLADVDAEKGVGELYKAKLSSKSLGEAEKLDDDVSTYGFGYAEDAGICYMKEYKDGKGDLYVEGKEIDFDAAPGVRAFKGGYLYSADGSMKYYKNGKKSTVADDVQSAVMLNDEKLVLLYDYSSESSEGTLGVWTGGKITVLDDEVSGLIQPSGSMVHSVNFW